MKFRIIKMWLFVVVFILLTCLFFISCSKKTLNTATSVIYKDSISVVDTVIFDTIIVPADTLITTYTIECDSLLKVKPFAIVNKSKRGSNIIQIDNNNKITSTVICDELEKIIATKNREIAIWKAVAYTKETHVSKRQAYIPKFFKICFGISLLIISLTIIKYIIKWRRIISPI